MRLLVKNISRIVGIESTGRLRCCGADMNKLDTLDDAWLLAEDGRFAAFGRMDSLGDIAADEVVDAAGGMLFPSFCDSHTHLVYAGSREREFLDKINGLSYEEIARRGGGILNSADRLHETSEDELYAQAMERVREIAAMGTGCVEIKSGYGLSTGDELKMLRVIRRIRESVPLEVRATFLGAHAVARAYRGRQGEYVDLVCNEMLPAVAAEGLADFVDVFCDEGFFTVEETARILKAARKLGLRAKIHANELAVSGGVQVGVACDALSVDHLERMGREEIEALRAFLAREDARLVLGPHHDVGASDDLSVREVEYRHHGDPLVPRQQRFATYVRDLMKGLGVPVVNRYGLRPATGEDNRIAPLSTVRDLDEKGWLNGVTNFNFHMHLPHYAVTTDEPKAIRVLARQPIDTSRPHPFTEDGNAEFNMFLWMPPSGDRAADVLLADSTIFSTLFGADDSLRNFWRNLVT